MLDNELVMSEKQAVTATALSTNAYDAGVATNLGAGEPIEFAVHVVDEDFAGLTSINFQLVGSANADLSSAEVIEESGAVAVALLKQGARPFRGTMNRRGKYRYYGFNYIVDGTGTAGKLTAYIGGKVPEQDYYAKGYEVNLTA